MFAFLFLLLRRKCYQQVTNASENITVSCVAKAKHILRLSQNLRQVFSLCCLVFQGSKAYVLGALSIFIVVRTIQKKVIDTTFND